MVGWLGEGLSAIGSGVVVEKRTEWLLDRVDGPGGFCLGGEVEGEKEFGDAILFLL